MKALFTSKRKSSAFIGVLLGSLALVFTTSFVWLANAPVIAPPMLRVQDLLWRLIVCGCY